MIKRKPPQEAAGCGFLADREIDSFLSGGLPDARTQAFEAHQLGGCQACALLAADLDVFRTVMTRGVLASERRHFESTRAIVKAALRQRLEQMEAKPAARFTWRWALAGAAALLVLAVLGPGLLRGPAELPGTIGLPGGERLAVQPIEPPAQVRDGSWDRALAAYVAGDYAEAARRFAAVEAIDPGGDASLYRGISLLLDGDSAGAVEALQRSRDAAREQGLTGVIAEYYLGLAWLDEGRTDEALAALRAARDVGGPFGERAAAVLNELDSE